MAQLLADLLASPFTIFLSVNNHDGQAVQWGFPATVAARHRPFIGLMLTAQVNRQMHRLAANKPELTDSTLRMTLSFDTLADVTLPLEAIQGIRVLVDDVLPEALGPSLPIAPDAPVAPEAAVAPPPPPSAPVNPARSSHLRLVREDEEEAP